MQTETMYSFNPQEYADIAELMTVLDPTIPFTEEKLRMVIDDANAHLFVLRDNGRIIGCCTMAVFFSPTGKKASLEDVAVLPEYQGKHLGRKLIEYALEEMRKEAPIHIQLTSRPSRIAANGLYKALGFKQKETNVYVLDVNDNDNN